MSADSGLPDLDAQLAMAPYALDAGAKAALLTRGLGQLTRHHRRHCADYDRMLAVLGDGSARAEGVADFPFLPVRLFKELSLLSVDRAEVVKTLTSSGTSGQQVSRIYLDRETAALQSKVLARLVTDRLGQKRLPMLVIDTPSVLRDRNAFSARGAAILGFSLFGRDVTYALDEHLQLDRPRVDEFLARHADAPAIFVFGFTFMVWQHLCQALAATGARLPLERGILLHGGGWKKLQDSAVDNPVFKAALADRTGLAQVINYYGMVEQTGTIYLECPEGHLHASLFSDVLIRDPLDFSPLPNGQTGLVEVVSLLPRSYPGHALLTEDLGTVHGEDDCPCGRLGKHFTVEGRLPRAEVRGCSDVHAPAS